MNTQEQHSDVVRNVDARTRVQRALLIVAIALGCLGIVQSVNTYMMLHAQKDLVSILYAIEQEHSQPPLSGITWQQVVRLKVAPNDPHFAGFVQSFVMVFVLTRTAIFFIRRRNPAKPPSLILEWTCIAVLMLTILQNAGSLRYIV